VRRVRRVRRKRSERDAIAAPRIAREGSRLRSRSLVRGDRTAMAPQGAFG